MKYLFFLLTILLAIGLVRPHRVLWFLNIKNRKNVLIVYGISWLVVLVILLIH